MSTEKRSPFKKASEAIPDNIKVMAKSAADKLLKLASGPNGKTNVIAIVGVVTGSMLIFFLASFLIGSSKIPSEDTMRKLVADREESVERNSRTSMISFSVDSCESVQYDSDTEIAECKITYQTVYYKDATNHMRHIPASKTKLPESTELFSFKQQENGKWFIYNSY